jgi:hypothetical protein
MSQRATDRRYLGLDGFRELVKSVKDVNTIDTSTLAVVSAVPVEVKAIGSEDSRLIEFIITTDRVDREQDVVAADGWDFKDYQNNPVVLWCHDHYAPVIGNSRSLSPDGNTIKSICEFTPQDLNPFGYMIYRLYAAKFMHAVSVGFQPLEYTLAADRKYGINYVRQGLLEYSAVPVPANPDAIAVARSKGIDTGPMFEWASRTLDEQSGMSDEARRRTEILRNLSAPSGRALILELGDMKMAGPAKSDDKPASTSTSIKKVDRWECGTKGHAHDSEAEAEGCASFDVAVTDATKQLQVVAGLIKSGSTIKPEAAALLRSVLDEVAPAAKADDADDDEEDEDEESDDKDGKKKPKEDDKKEDEGDEEDADKSLKVDEATLTEAIKNVFADEFNKVTGRVD